MWIDHKNVFLISSDDLIVYFKDALKLLLPTPFPFSKNLGWI